MVRSGVSVRRAAGLAGAALAILVTTSCGRDAAKREDAARVSRAKAAVAAVDGVCSGTGAHDKHYAVGVSCQMCHPCGGQYGFDSGFAYPGGSTATGTVTPATDTTPTTCSVGCHAPLGTPLHPVAWDAGPLDCVACHYVSALVPTHPAITNPSPTRADCELCHDVSTHTSGTVHLVGHPDTWMVQTDPGFHAFKANAGLGWCQNCHAQDLTGGLTQVSCAQCHDQNLPDGIASWKVNCVMCHGGKDSQTGAPPRTTWGNSADLVRVGAHTTHVAGSAIAPQFDCALCHVKPADALAAGHVDQPTASVAFNGMAANRGTDAPLATWDRTAATCANTYCHGSTLAGGTNTTPVWTKLGEGQADCGTCHGVPPPPPHPTVSNGLLSCNPCHDKTIDAQGVIIPPKQGGLHLDGILEASGHDATWMETTSSNFHAYSADRNIASCTACHGADLNGGPTASTGCGDCHDQSLPPGVASWRVNCVMCHGGTYNQTGAPPRTTWGNSADLVRVGAHTAHVGGSLAAPFGCEACHVKPTDALSTGHVDAPTATVTWGTLATTGGASPTWDRTAGTCASTYCHGSYSGTYAYDYDGYAHSVQYAGKAATPLWTDGAMNCGSCHSNPPQNYFHTRHPGGTDCQICHPDATGSNGVGTAITNPTLHVNGTIDLAPIWDTEMSCWNCH